MKNIEILKTKTILYAEDEINIRKSVGEILELFFQEVIIVNDGQKAIEAFYEQKIDVLLFDICMPYVDGLFALKEIRKQNEDIPAFIMSAHDEKDYLKQAIKLNVFRYIDKPFSKEIFISLLDDLSDFFIKKIGNKIYLCENVFYEPTNQQITVFCETKTLTKKEILALDKLIEKRGKVVSFDELQDAIYKYGEGNKDALKAVIKSLRKKISPALIENRFGSGYLLL